MGGGGRAAPSPLHRPSAKYPIHADLTSPLSLQHVSSESLTQSVVILLYIALYLCVGFSSLI